MLKHLSLAIAPSMGVVLATTSTETTGSWRHDADKWGIAFVVCTLLYFVLRWIAKREDEDRKRRVEREEREQKARDDRDAAANAERAGLLARGNELTEQLIRIHEDSARRYEAVVKENTASNSNVAQAVTTLTRKMKPCEFRGNLAREGE